MPNVRIREIDNTSAEAIEYNDYVVLVPGLGPKDSSTSKVDFTEKLFTNKDAFEKELNPKVLEWATKTPAPSKTNPEIYTIYKSGASGSEVYEVWTGIRWVVKVPSTTEPSEPKEFDIWKSGSTFKVYGAKDITYPSGIGYTMALKLLGLGMSVLYAIVGSETTTPDVDGATWWDKFEDKGVYDIRFLTSGGATSKTICEKMIKCAATRGDCVAVVDVPTGTNTSSAIESFISSLDVEDIVREDDTLENPFKYATCFAPEFSFKGQDTNLPGSLAYLSCFAKHINTFPAWFAMAGSVRGVIPFENVKVATKFGDADNNKLQDRKTEGYKAVNTICEVRPYGNIVWGNRTLYPLTRKGESLGLVASNFLNIRQLCCSIKKVVYRACRRFTFEPNSDALWTNFKNAIAPLLEEMKSGQGIRGYQIVRENTKEKATLKARIIVSPIEAVEDFDLTVELNDSVEVSE